MRIWVSLANLLIRTRVSRWGITAYHGHYEWYSPFNAILNLQVSSKADPVRCEMSSSSFRRDQPEPETLQCIEQVIWRLQCVRDCVGWLPSSRRKPYLVWALHLDSCKCQPFAMNLFQCWSRRSAQYHLRGLYWIEGLTLIDWKLQEGVSTPRLASVVAVSRCFVSATIAADTNQWRFWKQGQSIRLQLDIKDFEFHLPDILGAEISWLSRLEQA